MSTKCPVVTTRYKYRNHEALFAISLFFLASLFYSSVVRSDSTRVINGTPVKQGTFLSTVALIDFDGDFSGFKSPFCGGTVIGTRWILTAAHCRYFFGGIGEQREFEKVRIIYGVNGINDATLDNSAEIVNWFIHPEYNIEEQYNTSDLSVIELAHDIDVPLATLFSGDPDTLGAAEVIVTGWGFHEFVPVNFATPEDEFELPEDFPGVPSGGSGLLRSGAAQLIPNGDLCDVDSRLICTSVLQGSEVGACDGDSGSPLYIESGDQFVALGAVNYGTGPYCAQPDTTTVYASFSAFRDWISDYTPILTTDTIEQTAGEGVEPVETPAGNDENEQPESEQPLNDPENPESIEEDMLTAASSSGGGSTDLLFLLLFTLLAINHLRHHRRFKPFTTVI